MRTIALVIGTLLVAAAAVAAGAAPPARSAVVTFDAPGGEVCRFATSGDDPWHRWFSSQELTCVASGAEMPFPQGTWNVFARSASSISGDVMTIDAASVPAALHFAPVPAATLTASLPENTKAVVYAPKHAVAFPVNGKTSVPAGEELWLIVVSRGTPLDVHVLAPMQEGTQRTVDARTPDAAAAVIGWIDVPENDRVAIAKAHGVTQPTVRLHAATKEIAAEGLAPAEVMGGSLVLFRGVTPGDGDINLTGRGWLATRRHVTIGRQSLTVVRDPVTARASATLTIAWSTLSDLAALDRSFGSCNREGANEPPRFEITASICADPRPGEAVDAASCRVIHREPIRDRETYGSFTIEDAAAGTYRAELHYGKLPVYAVTDRVAPLQQEPIRIQASYLEAYGNLTRGGKPVDDDMRIDFPSGVGFAPGGSGEYHGVIRGLVENEAHVEIVPCNGTDHITLLMNQPMRRNSRYDLDIPDNVLTVTVVDTFTRAPLPAPTLRFVAMMQIISRGPALTRVYQSGGSQTVADRRSADPKGSTPNEQSSEPGRFVLRSVPPREIRLSITHAGYKRKDIEPFTMPSSGSKEIEVQLMPLSGNEGKIISSHPFDAAQVIWSSADGTETERADVQPDGTFVAEQRHGPPETMTVVSRSHPLWIAPAPLTPRSMPLTVHFPDQVRSREIMAVNQASGPILIGVAVGGLRVPQPAFVLHQSLRSLGVIVRGADLKIAPIVASAPIDVVEMALPLRVGPGNSIEQMAVRNFTPVHVRRVPEGNAIVGVGGP